MNKTALIFSILLFPLFCFANPESKIQNKQEAIAKIYARKSLNAVIATTKIATGGVIFVLAFTGLLNRVQYVMSGSTRKTVLPTRSDFALHGSCLIGGLFNITNGIKDFKSL